MEKFSRLTGVAAPLPVVNIDTDMIIPKDYLKTIKRTGLGKGLFAEARYNEDGSENPEFVLNQPAWRNASILIAGDNFGCGSSREHAPWALLDFGIRCVISTSFADIFYNNCFKNGILPIVVSQEDLDKLMDDAPSRRQRHGLHRSRRAGNPRPGWRCHQVRYRCLQKALPA
jgi:3-isopropylmalate/(R)-2-methylmalate dehydratase small subunit